MLIVGSLGFGQKTISLLLGYIIAVIADVIYYILESLGFESIVNLIFYKNSLFELNFYNTDPTYIIISPIYELLKSIAYILVFFNITYIAFNILFNNDSSNFLARLKIDLVKITVLFLLLNEFPSLCNELINIRQEILDAFFNDVNLSIDLIEISKQGFEDSNTITNALMYLISVFINIYYVYIYTFYYISFIWGFVLAPLVFYFALSNKFKYILDKWFINISIPFFMPIIDAFILYVISEISFKDNGFEIIFRLLFLITIIPTRNKIKDIIFFSKFESNNLTGLKLGKEYTNKITKSISKNLGNMIKTNTKRIVKKENIKKFKALDYQKQEAKDKNRVLEDEYI
ncbi:hypothetical protein WG909_14725 [Peptostreptococcaceae bacterium AGR-M142]